MTTYSLVRVIVIVISHASVHIEMRYICLQSLPVCASLVHSFLKNVSMIDFVDLWYAKLWVAAKSIFMNSYSA